MLCFFYMFFRIITYANNVTSAKNMIPIGTKILPAKTLIEKSSNFSLSSSFFGLLVFIYINDASIGIINHNSLVKKHIPADEAKMNWAI